LCRYRHFADATQLNSTILDVELSCVAINGTEAIIGHIEQYEVGTLDVDGWAVTIGTARRGLGGASKFFLPLCNIFYVIPLVTFRVGSGDLRFSRTKRIIYEYSIFRKIRTYTLTYFILAYTRILEP